MANQFDRIGTFCEKCRNVVCTCAQYEANLEKLKKGAKKLKPGTELCDLSDTKEQEFWIRLINKIRR